MFDGEGDDIVGAASHDHRLDVPAAEQTSANAFFKVTCANVGQWKRLKGDTDHASLSSCVLVRWHCVKELPTQCKIEVSAMPAVFFNRDGFMDTIQVLDGVDLSGICARSENQGYISALPSDFPASIDKTKANDVLSKFIVADAWPGTFQYLVTGLR